MDINFDVMVSILFGRKLCSDSEWEQLQEAEGFLISNYSTTDNLVDIYSQEFRNVVKNYLLTTFPELNTMFNYLAGKPEPMFSQGIKYFKENFNLPNIYRIEPIPLALDEVNEKGPTL